MHHRQKAPFGWVFYVGLAVLAVLFVNVSLLAATGWSLTGNADTSSTLNFLGTTDNAAFEIRVNNLRALRIVPDAASPNLIGGFSGNNVPRGIAGATISGGGVVDQINQVTANCGTVGGGLGNVASALSATVSGGGNNTASGYRSTVGGGSNNIASGSIATVVGGIFNTASGVRATVAGGSSNTAAGDYSFVAGRQAKNLDSTHAGVFLFADSTHAEFLSAAANEFAVRASGGYRLYTSADLTAGITMAAGSSSWSAVSDQSLKTNYGSVDTDRLLHVLSEMPVRTWTLRSQPETVRHVGPVSQDFNNSFSYLFGEVESPFHINMMDAVGVSLAASQGLYMIVQEQADQIAQLADEVNDLRSRLEALEQMIPAAD